MTEGTKIEWADHTFNAWTGCQKVGPGCDHCYAEGWAKRTGIVKWGPREPRRRTTDANWKQPLKWNARAAATGKRERVFCGSLMDVLDPAVPHHWRHELCELILATPHLDWILVTKRIGNAVKMWPPRWLEKPPPNVWWISTICNQPEADRDIGKLIALPGAVHGISYEPALGGVDFSQWIGCNLCRDPTFWQAATTHEDKEGVERFDLCGCRVYRLDWIICGGESGGSARPMHPDWALSVRDQCQAAGVPYFFKQWGEWAPVPVEARKIWPVGEPEKATAPEARFVREGDIVIASDGRRETLGKGLSLVGALEGVGEPMRRVGKKAAGRLLDGRTWDEMAQNPAKDGDRGTETD